MSRRRPLIAWSGIVDGQTYRVVVGHGDTLTVEQQHRDAMGVESWSPVGDADLTERAERMALVTLADKAEPRERAGRV